MSLTVVILAAGQGKRMRSSRPKVLHPVAGRPMLAHVLDLARRLEPVRICVVVGHGGDAVRDALAADDVEWVEQREQLGTGHAVLQALPQVREDDGQVLVLYGDVPLLPDAPVRELVAAGTALLTARVADPAGYGRIRRDAAGAFRGVVEDRDASDEERAIDEINTGVLAIHAALLRRYLPAVSNDNAQGEYYLPEVLPLAMADGQVVHTVCTGDSGAVLGINDRLQLASAEREFQRRCAEALLREDVTLADPARLDVRGSLRCGRDVFIDVGVVVEGDVTLGDGVRVGPYCVLRDVSVEAGSELHPFSHLDGARVGADCSVGPYARLRPGTVLADRSRVGNFVETKKAAIGAGSKVNHLSYVGDATLGAGVNVGAGTITCNYDGVAKHHTTLGDDVFIGSNSTLVAPLAVANGGFVAAGSTVTRDVGEDQLAVGRGRQRNIDGWHRPGAAGPDGKGGH
ncbi:MAG: bifunctional UDP-N-acetylglucosamine diphosphorylase/glucosamine-1-phosphate N-acetyltransferase GlmU [Pseudohaliea sp.]